MVGWGGELRVPEVWRDGGGVVGLEEAREGRGGEEGREGEGRAEQSRAEHRRSDSRQARPSFRSCPRPLDRVASRGKGNRQRPARMLITAALLILSTATCTRCTLLLARTTPVPLHCGLTASSASF